MTYILTGDCLAVMPTLEAESVDAIVSDPPYGLAFMGKAWDHGVPGPEFWREAFRVAKPGAHLVAFGGTRTYHRLTCAIEDAGWEIRDCLSWLYGSGFPKSLDVSKAMDKRGGYPHLAAQIGEALKSARESRGLTVGECDKRFCGGTTNWSWFEGRPKGQRAPTPETFAAIAADWPEVAHLAESVAEAEREVVGRGKSGIGTAFGDGEWARGSAQDFNITAPATALAREWQGWGTALKPAWEPIILARKPLTGTVASNVAQHGTGAINVDGCRIEGAPPSVPQPKFNSPTGAVYGFKAGEGRNGEMSHASGRWPANVCLDEEAAGMLDAQTGELKSGARNSPNNPQSTGIYGTYKGGNGNLFRADSGGASRFFFVAKEGQCDNASDAVLTSSHGEQVADSAPSLASPSRSPAPLPVGRESTADCTACTPRQSLALSVEAKDSTDTIQTTPTSCESCGSALRVTADSTSQASAVRVEDASDPVSGTRFLYTAKASRREREAGLEGMPTKVQKLPGKSTGFNPTTGEVTHGYTGEARNHHPTVKPIALMRWLCRLVTPKGGLILDPFTGSGTTGCAAVLEGFRFVGIEREPEYAAIAEKRIAHWAGQVEEPTLFEAA